MKAISITAAILGIFLFGCSAETKEGVEDLVAKSKDAIKSLENNAAYRDDRQGREQAAALGVAFFMNTSKCQQHDYKCQYRYAKEFYESSTKLRDHYVELNKTFVKPPQELLESAAWHNACLKIVDSKFSKVQDSPFKQGDLARVASVILVTGLPGGPQIQKVTSTPEREIGVHVKQPDSSKELYTRQFIFKRAVQIVPENECAAKGIPGNEQIGNEMLKKYIEDDERAFQRTQDEHEKEMAEIKRRQDEQMLIERLQKK